MLRATKTKTISLEPETLTKGERMAKQRGFKNSFSAYVAKLIEDDDLALREQQGTGNSGGGYPLPEEAIHAQ